MLWFFVAMWLVQAALVLWVIHLHRELQHQRKVSKWLAHDLARVVKDKLKLQKDLRNKSIQPGELPPDTR